MLVGTSLAKVHRLGAENNCVTQTNIAYNRRAWLQYWRLWTNSASTNLRVQCWPSKGHEMLVGTSLAKVHRLGAENNCVTQTNIAYNRSVWLQYWHLGKNSASINLRVQCWPSKGHEMLVGTSLAKVHRLGAENNCVTQTNIAYNRRAWLQYWRLGKNSASTNLRVQCWPSKGHEMLVGTSLAKVHRLGAENNCVTQTNTQILPKFIFRLHVNVLYIFDVNF